MLTKQDINDFCDQHNYDIRVSGNGRWIDQKCTADVVCAIADFIYNYIKVNGMVEFTAKDIWHYDYAVENIQAVFRKPGVKKEESRNEYDKFFQQPMEMLAYAGVLGKRKNGTRNIYWVEDTDILEYIALREKNALVFIQVYVEKVLRDSEVYDIFDSFFSLQTKDSFAAMKRGFADFTINNTRINGKTECGRIFTKVLNPMAFDKGVCGTENGVMSREPITLDKLMYNRNNFRDVYSNKPKGVTRKEYAAEHPVVINEDYYHYQSTKAKRFLKRFNEEYRNSMTEYIDNRTNPGDPADHIHHIFPEAEYPEICFYLENLIALTPTQHVSFAHPRGRTAEIDEQYQQLLLLAKSSRIEENITNDSIETIYEFGKFVHVLNVGFEKDEETVIEIADMDFSAVVNAINVHYSTPYNNKQNEGYLKVADETIDYKA